MAYAPKYRTRAADLSGYRYRIEIAQDGWGGGITDIAPAEGFYDEEVGQQGGGERLSNQPIQISSVRFAVDASPGLLTEFFDAPDREYLVTVERQPFEDGAALGSYTNHWRGFLVPDFYQDEPFERVSRIQLEAIDGLVLLKHNPYKGKPAYDGDTLYYETEESIWSAFERILHGLYYLKGGSAAPQDLRVHQRWAPGMSSYNVPEPVWQHIAVQRENWREGKKGEDAWRSEWDMLEEMLLAFNSTLMQSGFQWHVRQRAGLESTGNVVTQRDSSGTVQLVPLERRDASSFTSERGTRRTFMRSAAQASSTYHFGDVFEGFVSNASFEKPVSDEDWTLYTPYPYDGNGEVVARREELQQGDTPDPSQENQWRLEMAALAWEGFSYTSTDKFVEQTLPLRLAANPANEVEIGFEGSLGHTSSSAAEFHDGFLQRLQVQIGGFYLDKQTTTVTRDALRTEEDGILHVSEILPSGSGALVPEGATLPIFDASAGGPNAKGERVGTITLSRPLGCGDSALYGQISSDITANGETYVPFFTWSTQQARPSIHELFGFPGEWTTASLRTYLRTPAGVAVAGENPTLSVWSDVDISGVPSPSGEAVAYSARLDRFRFVVSREGNPLTQSTVVASVDSGHTLEGPTVRVGDGPTTDAASRLRAQDDQGNWHDLTGDWYVKQ